MQPSKRIQDLPWEIRRTCGISRRRGNDQSVSPLNGGGSGSIRPSLSFDLLEGNDATEKIQFSRIRSLI